MILASLFWSFFFKDFLFFCLMNSMEGGELFNKIIKRAKPFTEKGKLCFLFTTIKSFYLKCEFNRGCENDVSNLLSY